MQELRRAHEHALHGIIAEGAEPGRFHLASRLPGRCYRRYQPYQSRLDGVK